MVELMVVMAILAILVSIVAMDVVGTSTTGRATTKAQDMDTVQQAVDRYEIDNVSFPCVGDLPTVGLDIEDVAASMIEEIDMGKLVPGYLREEPNHADEDPEVMVGPITLDLDPDWIILEGTTVDLDSPWIMDNLGNVYCLIDSSGY